MAGWPLERQTPGSRGVWKNCRFFVNQELEECDYWVVYDDVVNLETTRCCPQNTLLVMGEPPSVRTYDPRFTAQFAALITVQPHIKHPHVIQTHLGLPWLIGGRYLKDTNSWESVTDKNYDELKEIHKVEKTRLLSVICSDKAFTSGHAQRLEFVQKLKRYFGDDLDVYGRGINDFQDKWEAISPYKYHIAIENSVFPNYWTEKLTDTFLADAYPLYYGCPNISDYFSTDALSHIDITDVAGSISQIKTIFDQGRYEKSEDARIKAKSLILDEYNLFSLLEDVISSHYRPCTQKNLSLRAEAKFLGTPLARTKRGLHKVWGKFLAKQA